MRRKQTGEYRRGDDGEEGRGERDSNFSLCIYNFYIISAISLRQIGKRGLRALHVATGVCAGLIFAATAHLHGPGATVQHVTPSHLVLSLPPYPYYPTFMY